MSVREKKTRTDKLLEKIKNHPVLSVVVTVGIVVTAFGVFIGGIEEVAGFIGRLLPKKDWVRQIAGRWRVLEKDTEIDYLIFEVENGKLYGTVYPGHKGIVDGEVHDNTVSFRQPYTIVESGPWDPETKAFSPSRRTEKSVKFDGKVQSDRIEFKYQREDGHGEFTAIRVVDLTERAAAQAQGDGYILAYTLPGHTGGVASLSFGPLGALRPTSGGLYLVSGGAVDGQVRFWDTATTDTYSERLTGENGKGFVLVAYRPTVGERKEIDLCLLGVDTVNRQATFVEDSYFQSGSHGRSGHPDQDLDGTLGPAAIAADLSLTATAEITAKGERFIKLRSSHGDVKRVLPYEGEVLALALSRDGRLLASTEEVAAGKAVVRVLETSGGEKRWQSLPQSRPVELAFGPGGGLLATGGPADRTIRIWEVASGRVKLELDEAFAEAGVSALAFDDSGNFLAASGGSPPALKLWDLTTHTVRQSLEVPRAARVIAFSRDGRLMASAGADEGEIRVWVRPRPK